MTRRDRLIPKIFLIAVILSAMLCTLSFKAMAEAPSGVSGVATIPPVAPAQNENSGLMQPQHVSKMEIRMTIGGNEITAYFTGYVINGRPAGSGLYMFEDTHGTWTFEGTLKDGAFYNGTMTDYPYTMNFTDANGYSTYTGPFTRGKPAGEGKYTIVTDDNTTTMEGRYDPESGFTGTVSQLSMSLSYNGTPFTGLYSGDYREDQPNGSGSFACDGEMYFYYDGIWNNGNIIGPGELHTNNAHMNFNGVLTRAEYEGHIEKGKFNGAGKLTITGDGNLRYVYDGNWANDLYSGAGTLTVTSDDSLGYTYTGAWEKGVYNGEGSLIYDSDDIIKYIGNFENGEFRPTVPQLITSLCSAENSKVELTDDVIGYIDVHQSDFLNHVSDGLEITRDFPYEAYVEAQDEHDGSCFATALKMVQIREYNPEVFGSTVTEFLGYDGSQHIYYGYYLGALEGITSGDEVDVIAYPVGSASYKNQNGGAVTAVRFLACSVEKRE